MGRWIYSWDAIRSWSIYVGKNELVSIETIDGGTLSGINTLEMLHNADCDAYEARIAELEAAYKRQYDAMDVLVQDLKGRDAELARVKAESLRVVPVGEACALGTLRYEQVMYKGRVYEHIQDLDYWTQITGDDPLCLGEPDTIVQPVRLERWEDE